MSNCGWSGTLQQHSELSNFRTNNLFENEEYGETVAGVTSTTTQRRKDDRKKQQRERIVEFSKKLFKNEEYGETVAGVISTTTQ